MIQYNIAAISPKITRASIENIDLQQACRLGDIEAIKRAHKIHPEKINERDESFGWTPLYRTIISGHLKGAEYLLKHQADPNIINNIGEAPIHQAADNSQYSLAEILLKYGANPNLQQNDGDTSLHHAAYRGDSKMAEILLKHKADPNIPNFMFGRTPLHYAADCGHIETIDLMVKHGGDLGLTDNHGKTPIDIAHDKDVSDHMSSLLFYPRESEILTSHKKAPMKSQSYNFEPESEISVIRKKSDVTPLFMFLERNDLLEIHEILIDNGFDDLDTIVSQMQSSIPIKKEDLIRIGITKIGLVYKFLMKIDEQAGISPYNPAYTRKTTANLNITEKTLDDFLEELQLSELKSVFIDAGFDDTDTMLNLMHSRHPITDEFLLDIGILKLGHRNRILTKLQEDTKEKKEGLIIDKTSNNVSCQKCLIM